MNDHVKDLIRRVTQVKDLLTEAIADYEKTIVEEVIITIPKERITPDQYDDLMWELEGHPELVKNIQKTYKIETLAELPRDELRNVKIRMRTIFKEM